MDAADEWFYPRCQRCKHSVGRHFPKAGRCHNVGCPCIKAVAYCDDCGVEMGPYRNGWCKPCYDAWAFIQTNRDRRLQEYAAQDARKERLELEKLRAEREAFKWHEQQQQREQRRQREALRQGEITLRQMRRYLSRGVLPSQQMASEPARTSRP